MDRKKEEDEANQVQGRENFDYTVQKKRKRLNRSQINLDGISEQKEEKKNEIDHEVLDWIKEKIESSVKMFDESKHWTKPLEEAVKKLCLLESMCSRLFVWISNDETIFSTEVPH